VASTRHKVSPAHALRARRLRTLRKKWSNVGPARVLRTGNLEIVDGKGRLRGVFGSGVQLGIVDEEGNYQAGFGLGDDGQAHISVSAVPKDRGIRMTALPDGNISMLFTAESAPLIDLGLVRRRARTLPPTSCSPTRTVGPRPPSAAVGPAPS
jgi:hypothetical protein